MSAPKHQLAIQLEFAGPDTPWTTVVLSHEEAWVLMMAAGPAMLPVRASVVGK